MKKIINLVLSLAIFLFVFTGTAMAQVATLALSPSNGTLNKGCGFAIDVNIDTANQSTTGVDAVLLYDSSKLRATTINTVNTTYSSFPDPTIDETKNTIRISGIAESPPTYKGKGKIATVNFLVKEDATTGLTEIKFDYDSSDPLSTADTNIITLSAAGDEVNEVLKGVTNGSYTIGTGNCAANSSATPPPGGIGRGGPSASQSGGVQNPIPIKEPFEEIPQKGPLPDAGTEEVTITVAIVALGLILFGVLGLVL